ncbi:MAG: hypothetical protein WBI07_11315, partial [Mobilitalea sp.]
MITKAYLDFSDQIKQEGDLTKVLKKIGRSIIPGGINVMDDELKIKMYSFTLDCKDTHELSKFYAA